MFKNEITYGYDDVCIIPAITTDIEHRVECLTKKEGMLPIFTAPMSSVVNEQNAGIFQKNGIIPIIPRNIPLDRRNELVKTGVWVSYSLNEFEDFIKENETVAPGTKILIDLANGHMKKMLKVAKAAKEKYGYDNLILMSGNIANAETYKDYCRAGIDFIRVGIGGGCFHPDTLIKTKNGIKKIADVTLGDEVLTHKNRYKKVVDKKCEKTNNNMVLVNNIKCTDNHMFYVVNSKDKDIINENNLHEYGYWVEAGNLNKDEHLLIHM
jgi:hypothetical protein